VSADIILASPVVVRGSDYSNGAKERRSTVIHN